MSIESPHLHYAGPLFIGLVVSAVFGGITIIQVITYARKTRNDPLGQKLAVWFLWSFDMLHLCFMTHMVYHSLVSNPRDPGTVWSFPAHILIEVIIVPVTQWLYVARIWTIATRDRKYVPAVLSILVLINLAAGIAAAAVLSKTPVSHMITHIPALPAVMFFLVTTSLLDSLIAGRLCYIFSRARANLSWTDSSFTMLVAYIINTGAIVSIFSISILIIFLLSETSSYFLALGAVSTRFYVNSFLGMVNARHYLQPTRPQTQTTLVLHSETSSRNESINNNPEGMSKTINEIGLPLFQHSTASRSEDIKMLEVTVKKEAHSSEI